MKKQRCPKILSILLVLVLLLQNLAIPVHADGDIIPTYCPYCKAERTNDQIKYIPPVAGAGCTDKGRSEGWQCLVCEEYIVKPESTDPPGHKRQEVAEVPATCTTPGTRAGEKCSVCGEILSGFGEIPAKGHTEETIPGKDATCTETGLTAGTKCSVCGTILKAQEVIQKEEHAKINRARKEPTCTEDGWTAGWVCENGCGTKEGLEVIPAKGHDKNITVAAKAPTCTEAGCTEGWNCKNCTYKEDSTTIPATGHTPVTDEAVPATCTTKGKTAGSHCSVCNTVLVPQEETDYAAHTPVTDEAVPATCTTNGKTAGSHCSVCNEVLEKQEVIPAAHQDVVDMEAKDPTCTEPGQQGGKYCAACGEVLEEPEVLPAHGHEKEVTTEAKAPTCTKDGCTEGWKCIIEDCGYEVASEVIKATGHTEKVIPAKAATCTKTGLTEGKKCSVCGKILKAQKEITKTAHKEVAIPGWSATCTKIGKTEGKKCSVCQKVITPQYEIGKAAHQFVPAKDTDPNAGALDYVCSVCGEKRVGLMQGSGSQPVPYEKVDPASGSNGFNLTVGDDYAKEGSAETLSQEISSGKLEVYQSKSGSDKELLCLMSPESTMTHLSFEAGTSGIGKVSIASQNNPTGGATTMEPGDGVGQFGFGIGSDENGKSYLYIEEDGKEVSFTITKEEDEDGRNRVILTTENGSKITIESDSLWYKVQSWDQTTQLSGSQLEVEKTTTTLTNTNENGGSSEAVVIEIVFGVKDLGGSEETKPENGIQAIIEEQEQTIEEFDTGDNSITVLEESEQAKNYVDIIDLSPQGIREEDWDPENCKNDIHWPVNGKCKFCGERCSHKHDNKLNVTAKEHTCILCGYTSPHIWIRWKNVDGTYVDYMSCTKCAYHCGHPSYSYASEGVCKCNECGLALIHHWENGICKKCGGKCPHSKVDKKCVCKECGLVAHNYKMSPAYDTDSVCTRCKTRCSHSSFVIDGDYCKCTTCGRIQTHYWKHSKTPIPNCVCKYCGKTQAHDYNPVTGTCKRCMNECDHTCASVSVGKCKCTKCGHTMSHKWVEGKSGCVCSYCGYELSHLFSFTWGGTTHYVAEYGKTSCTRCGAECKHSFSNCKCTICGAMAKHQWRNGTCTVCAAACEHLGCDYRNTTDCVCSECGTVRKHDWKKKGLFYECTQCGFLTLRKPK